MVLLQSMAGIVPVSASWFHVTKAKEGSVHTCRVVALGSIPVAHGKGLWSFVSHPSTLETVYLSQLT